jgi:hypothetical protein
MREDRRAGNLQCSALLLKDFGQRNMRTGRKDSGQSIVKLTASQGASRILGVGFARSGEYFSFWLLPLMPLQPRHPFEEEAAQREDLMPVRALHWDIQRLRVIYTRQRRRCQTSVTTVRPTRQTY